MLIAEIGINHLGNLELAKKMILSAKDNGADIVKFQKRNIDKCIPDSQKNVMRKTPWGVMTYYDYKKHIEFGKKEYDEIDMYCKEIGIRWTSSIWDEDSLEFLLQYDVPFIKIPSAIIKNVDLLKKIAKTNKKVIISTGMSKCLDVLNAVGLFDKNNVLCVMHCVSNYSNDINNSNIANIQRLKKLLDDIEIGYSAHNNDEIITCMCIGMGVKFIEHHFTLNNNDYGTDQKISILPHQLKTIKHYLDNIDNIIGTPRKMDDMYDCEKTVSKKLIKN